MKTGRVNLPCLSLTLLSLCAAPALAQQSEWARHMDAAKQAEEQGKVQLAEEHYRAAVKEARRLGPDEDLLGTSLNRLGSFYQRLEPTRMLSSHVRSRFTCCERNSATSMMRWR
jgi:hypothetical protein